MCNTSAEGAGGAKTRIINSITRTFGAPLGGRTTAIDRRTIFWDPWHRIASIRPLRGGSGDVETLRLNFVLVTHDASFLL